MVDNLPNQTQSPADNLASQVQQQQNQPEVQQITQQTGQQVDTSNQNNQPVVKTFTEEEVNALHRLYGQSLRDKEIENQNLRGQQHLRPQDNNIDPEKDKQTFFEEPRKLIREEIDRSIAPIAQAIQSFQFQQSYEAQKNNFKNHPQYGMAFRIPNFESMLDQAMQGVQPTVENIAGRIQYIYGNLAMQGLVNPINSNQPQQVPVQQSQSVPQPNFNQNIPANNLPMNNNQPAHLRPSSPAMPNGNPNNSNLTPNGNVRFQLNELQDRVRKEQRLSVDEYIDWLNETSRGVVTSKIGQNSNGGK